jgi:hypothetical protein
MYWMEAYSTCNPTFENFANIDGGQHFEVGPWYHDMPETEDLIQAITVPGGLMLTPIELMSRPLYIKELKMSLVAPPILLQTRRMRTSNCTYALRSEYNNKVWENAVDVACQGPYVCPEELTTVPTSLMACSSPESDERFFGKNPTVRYGLETYFEFLQSISDAPFLVRDDEPRSTRAFIDSQTTCVNGLMIAYSPQYGIVSTINIMAELEADVRVDYDIQHYQSLEGDDFKSYRIVVIFEFVLSMIVLIEKIITVKYSTKDYHMRSFCFDMIIQVILPLIYYSIEEAHFENNWS